MKAMGDASFDAVVDKGTADTLQFRCRAGSRSALVQRMLAEVVRTLKPRGHLLLVSSRATFPLLHQFFENVHKTVLSKTGGTMKGVRPASHGRP
jgi:hypothetical protein